MNDSCLFVVAERHPASETVAIWGDSAWVATCGLSDPVALVEWLVGTDGRVPGHLVVLCRHEEVRAARLIANVASGRLPGMATSVVAHRSTGQAAAVAAQLAATDHLAGGAAVEAVLEAVAQLRSGVVLRSVANLDRPRPTLGQHLRSILPWRPRFVAWCGEAGSVATLDRSRPAVDAGGRRVLLQEAADPAGEGLFVLDDSAEVVTVPPVVDVRAQYGSTGAEFTLLPTHLATAARTGSCPACGSRLVAPVCPACHVHAVRPSGDGQHAVTGVATTLDAKEVLA